MQNGKSNNRYGLPLKSNPRHVTRIERVFKKLKIRHKKIFCCFALFLAILFSYFAISNVKSVNINGWKGYHTLLVEKSTDNNSIYTKLRESDFFSEVVSEYNTEVEYSNYNSLSYITVDKLEKRFNKQDPRFDDFIGKISGYFNAYSDNKPYSVYYLKTDASYNQASDAINFILGSNYRWLMPKYENYWVNAIFLFLYIFITSIFIYNNRKQWFIYLLHTIPWAFLIYFNGKSYFFPAVFMLFILRVLLLAEKELVKEYINNKTLSFNKYCDKKTIFIIGITVFSFVLPIVVSMPGADSFITPISILLFDVFFIVSNFVFTYLKVTGYSHKIFYATQIGKQRNNTIFSLSTNTFALIFFLAIATLPFYFFNTGDKSIKYPVPVAIHKYPESGLTLDFLKRISLGNANDNFLPDYCEYIKHLAYQIRLPYKADYSIPANNEEVTISNYYLEKNAYKREKIRVNQFTDIWLSDNITINKGMGITGLMLSDTGLIRAETGAIVPAAVPLFIIPVIFGFLYPIFFYFLYGIKNGIKNTQIYGTVKKTIPVIRRRKQQAA